MAWNGAGQAAGLPASVFCKGTQSLESRYMLGMNEGVQAEVNFYNVVRPKLAVIAPEALFAHIAGFMAGASKTVSCGVCHGVDLKGLGPVPAIAGRSPSYIMRQLWDLKQGTRKGVWSPLMKPIVENLTQEDMLSIAAYVASR